MGRPSRTVTISIPPELADRIDRAAEAEGCTRSELLREEQPWGSRSCGLPRSLHVSSKADAGTVSVPWNPSMERETVLLVAIVMLSLAAFSVGVSGFVLLARDRRLRRTFPPVALGAAGHHEVPEER